VSDWPLSPGVPLVGDPAVGQQTGDRLLPSGIGNSESLCARVDFPLSAGNEYQDTSVTLNLVFTSEQTLNN
jgi:hypothetical protein